MSAINKHNCEAWFLDYFEGNLNAEQSEQLFRFLEENPQFQKVFSEYENVSLEPENLSFNVQTLFKDIPVELANEISGSEYVAIAYTENILSDNEKGKITDIIKHEKALRDKVDLYSKLKLKPDTSIVFEQKNKLKKPLIIPFIRFKDTYKYVASAAAIVLFALTLWNYLPKENNENIIGLAAPSKRPMIEFKSKQHNSETFKMPVNVQKEQKFDLEQISFKNKKVQTSKYLEKIENEEIEVAEKVDQEIEKEQNKDKLEIVNINEKSIKSEHISENNVKTLNEEKYLNPEDLIVSKLLKTDAEALSANENIKKSKFWNIIDLASKRYSDITGRKVKIKKVVKEDKTVFALITDKFEISHTASKK
ncbi:MAG: hypothetical protein KatS3mg027_1806 [Bacteroidia bacterium]|nr:MAG: hypothetical protein KatS3mg027_1806 [Bacteroidia bacterium]